MGRFIMVFKVFCVKNRLGNEFLGQKHLTPNFLATIVAGIWAKSDDASSDFFQNIGTNYPRCSEKRNQGLVMWACKGKPVHEPNLNSLGERVDPFFICFLINAIFYKCFFLKNYI